MEADRAMMTLRYAFPLLVAGLLAITSAAGAVHFYRGSAGGCTPADGALTDDPVAPAPSAATVLLMHSSFHDEAAGAPVTRIGVGDAVTWTWNSAHCHSVVGAAFYSGYHHPETEPGTPALLPGLFHFPLPTLAPSLSFTHTFTEPGTYTYSCEHHAAIGMVGVVIVE